MYGANFVYLRYDSSLFVLDLLKNTEERYMSIIPENLGKFKTFQTREFIFIDSFQFLTTSLANLVDNLKTKGLSSFKKLQQQFPGTYIEDGVEKQKAELLMEKGVFPYDYCTSFSVFSEPCLPPIEEFYNALNEEALSEQDYARALKTFEVMGCTTLGEYMELYVLTDTILLADVFENFRDMCLEYYKLDPCHYFRYLSFQLLQHFSAFQPFSHMFMLLKYTSFQLARVWC